MEAEQYLAENMKWVFQYIACEILSGSFPICRT